MKVIIDMPDYGSVDNILKACENAQPLSTELEKIKTEIEKEREEMANVKDWGRYYGLGLSLRIIDNHISKLKGK